MNQKDFAILSNLRNNSRISLTQMSKKTNIPVSTLFDKLKKFENGLIKKHTSLIDFQKMGYDLRVNLMLKVDREDKSRFEEFLIKNENVNSLFKINNGYDFLVEGIFTNMKDFQSFTDLIEKFKITHKEEFYILDELKKEAFMADPLMSQLINQNKIIQKTSVFL